MRRAGIGLLGLLNLVKWPLLLVGAGYVAVLILLFFAQTQLLFPVGAVAKPKPLAADAQRLEFAGADGERLHGVHFPPAQENGLLVLGFAGNAWNAEAAAAYLHELFPRAHVVAFHYRGYPPSGGRPSAKALLADAPAVYDHAVAAVRPRRVIVVGFSIGTAMAARVAHERQVAGAILVTPFDKLETVAASHYPWVPVRLLLRHRFDAAADLRRNSVPVAVIAAARDQVIPVASTDALRRAARSRIFDRTIRGRGHNDIYEDPAFRQAMMDAMATFK